MLIKGDYVIFIDHTLDIVPMHRRATVVIEADEDGYIWVEEWDTHRNLRVKESEVRLQNARD